ncbi:DUF742 domain-containing protein [Streptomyces sp. RFCAC02]|uniref:DUF742 domain-containing protein n=1 Tax=Streptomyces sp. RFCAC02 TaxID=2499143 RepID=UPI001F0F763C|nr:DUF742 domain-containing protein [Streptomyces sp. RFCAC02]
MTLPSRGARQDRPVPLYVVTGGRSESDGEGGGGDPLHLDLVTLVITRSVPDAADPGPDPELPPEAAALLRACQYPLSVAEISAHLGLPFNAITILLTDLAAAGHVELRQTRAERRREAADPDIETLKALIDGLQRL